MQRARRLLARGTHSKRGEALASAAWHMGLQHAESVACAAWHIGLQHAESVRGASEAGQQGRGGYTRQADLCSSSRWTCAHQAGGLCSSSRRTCAHQAGGLCLSSRRTCAHQAGGLCLSSRRTVFIKQADLCSSSRLAALQQMSLQWLHDFPWFKNASRRSRHSKCALSLCTLLG